MYAAYALATEVSTAQVVKVEDTVPEVHPTGVPVPTAPVRAIEVRRLEVPTANDPVIGNLEKTHAQPANRAGSHYHYPPSRQQWS